MMRSKKQKKPGTGKVDREQMIAAIRAAVEAGGGEEISYRKFLTASKMERQDLWRNFSKWSEALKAAGFVFSKNGCRVGNDRLLADLGRTARKLGRAPSMKEYAALGEFNKVTLKKRFGGPWWKVMGAFRSFAAKNQEWTDVLAMLPEPGVEGDAGKRRLKQGRRCERLAKQQARKEDRQISGDPLYVEGISHAPINETGVVLLFGAMAAKLGFTVEAVRANFPDCQAKRRIGPDAWLTLRIEFEYESRNFRDHGHPPEGCDMIVCWVHNWSDCPERLKVVALSDELARLRRERVMLAF